MVQKQALVETIGTMPAVFDSEEIIEKILFLKNLEQATEEADQGNLLTEQELKSRLGKWLS